MVDGPNRRLASTGYHVLTPRTPPYGVVTLGSVSSSPGTWAEIAAYVEGSGTNAAVRNMVRALCELYEVRAGEITEGNCEKLDSEIRRRNADPSWMCGRRSETDTGKGAFELLVDPFTSALRPEF